MKPLLMLVVLSISIGPALNAQVIRPFSLRYSNPSVRGNIVYLSNELITSPAKTFEPPPGGSGTNNNGASVNINVDGTIFDFGATWKYLDNNTRPANWQTSGFNDAGWASGPGQLGFGDGDESTVVSYGPNASNKYITTYFRKSINIPNPGAYTSFMATIHYDDAFVLYINGVEINRTNLPSGTITHSTLATAAAEATINISIPVSAFSAGANTIAVEVHQNNKTSTDLSFDMGLTGFDGVIFNSSTADLSLPACSQVMWAGLYWGAGQGKSGSNTAWITGETTCGLKIPGAGSYTTVTSSQTDYHNNTLIPGFVHTGYKCFADITSLVNTSSPNGTYAISNIASPAGIVDAYGGWTIVVAYTNANAPIRNLTVYDGNAAVKSGSGNVDVSISGFLTPPSGPVTCELGAVAYDGDRGSTDAFSFQQGGSGPFYDLTPNATSNANDMWNSTISYKGSVVTTRNPAHQNTLGYDADIIDVPNASNAQLGNNQTNAVARFSSPNENYIVHVLSTSISQFDPSIQFVKSSTDLNGGSLVGADVLRYRLDFKNVGDDAALAAVITDNIPEGSTYKPGSLTINGLAQTDAASDDQSEFDVINNRIVFRVGSGANGGNGGTLTATGAATDSGYAEFEVYVTSSCELTACGSALSNSARIDYTGNTSLSALSDSSGVLSGGCFSLGPLINPIAGACYIPNDTILINQCPVTTVMVPATFYAGYRLYSALPFISANLFDPAAPVSATSTIYAYGMNGSCEDTVVIRVRISACPDIDDDKDGLPDYVESNIPGVLADADGDGTPNYRDADYPGFIDNNSDGINDNFDPGADSDNDGIPNFLDTDIAGFTDANNDGVNDHFDTDLDGVPDYLDIDSDNDGIPDNIEAQATSSYTFPSGLDSDGDGLDNTFDNMVGTGGNGITPLDTDGDLVPDYLDTDADGDGLADIYEGNDLNFNNLIDDNVVLTGLDTDGDGLDDFFDNDNSSNKGTSAYMGSGGSATGDPSPGSITTVQRTLPGGCPVERDWRCTMFVLECSGIALKGNISGGLALLEWFDRCNQPVDHFIIERSMNGNSFQAVGRVNGQSGSTGGQVKYTLPDRLPATPAGMVYYRVISVSVSGQSFHGPIITLSIPGMENMVRVLTNPVRGMLDIAVRSAEHAEVEVRLFNSLGSVIMTANERAGRGDNMLTFTFPSSAPSGVYYLHVRLNKKDAGIVKLNHIR